MRVVRTVSGEFLVVIPWVCLLLHPLLSFTEGDCCSRMVGYLWVTDLIFIGTFFLLLDLPFVFLRVILTFVCFLPSALHYSLKSKVKAQLFHRRSQW